MDQFIPQTPFDWIGLALVVAVLVRIGWAAFIDYCESTPIYDPMVAGPKFSDEQLARFKEATNSLERMLDETSKWVNEPLEFPESLRCPLPPARNMAGAAQADMELAVQRQMAADTMKGTKL